MNRTKVAAGIILIFVLGCLAGSLAVQLYHRQESRDAHRRHRTPEERVDFIMKRLDRDLDLTAQQAADIRPIVETNEKAISEIKERVAPEIRGILDKGFSAIRKILTPVQQRKLDGIRERMRNFSNKPQPTQ
jgi:hypothetical protein